MQAPHILILHSGRHLGEFAVDLARGVSAKYRTTLVLSRHSESLRSLGDTSGFAVRVLPAPKASTSLRDARSTLDFVKALRSTLQTARPDLVLDCGLSPWTYLPRRAFGPARLAVVVHDSEPHPGRVQKLSHRADIARWRTADVLIALSDYSARVLRCQVDGRVVVGMHGERHKLLSDTPAQIASRRKNLLFWGRLESYKGLGLLANALERAQAELPDLHLSVVGRGRLETSTRSRLLSVGASIREEWIDEAEIPAILRQTGLIVLPYTSASQSGPAAMAVSNGIPAVATNVGGLPEQIRHLRNGLVVPPNDAQALASAIVTIASDSAMATKMSQEALRIWETEERWEVLGPRLIAEAISK